MSSEWIEIHPDVCNGRPVVRGTRISVQALLKMVGVGDSADYVSEGFHSLHRDQLLAYMDHAEPRMGNRTEPPPRRVPDILLKGFSFWSPPAHESPVGVGWWGFRGRKGVFPFILG